MLSSKEYFALLRYITTDMDYRESIIVIVNTRRGIDEIRLRLDVMSYVNPVRFDDKKYNDELSKLILEGEVVRYMFGINNHQVFVYFPKGTSQYGETKIRPSTNE